MAGRSFLVILFFGGGKGAFVACPVLAVVNIGSTMKYIEDHAFNECPKLAKVNYVGTKAQWGLIEISDNNAPLLNAAFSYSGGSGGGDVNPTPVEIRSGICGRGASSWGGDLSAGFAARPWEAYWTDDLRWTLSDDGVLRISGEGTVTNAVVMNYQKSYYVTSPWFDLRRSVSELIIESGTTVISFNAFHTLSAMEKVTLPKSLNAVYSDAFAECGAIGDVYYEGTEAEWKKITFDKGNSALTKARIHYNSVIPPEATDDPTDDPTNDPKDDPTDDPKDDPTDQPTDDPAKMPFKDVAAGAYYAKAVSWAVSHEPQITKGTGETTFSPGATCTRGQVVTFLWRAKGEPEPTSSSCPFTDVKETDYFYKAVLWAVENDVTKGTGATTFSPAAGCTRGQVVTFLHRAEGEPSPAGTAMPFTDVKRDGFYRTAVIWAVEKKITNGTGATTFSPNDTCTRGQIVTFLYRGMTGDV